MKKFWQLLQESTLIQALMSLMLLATILYLYIVGREVPQELTQFMVLILGFYFGSKSQQVISTNIKKG